MKRKRTSLLLVALLMLTSGCDDTLTAVGAVASAISGDAALALTIAALRDDDDDNWWEENDEHFDWHFWPFN